MVSFVTAPGSTATPCSRNMDAAVVFVPTKSTAIASRRLAWGSNYDGCAAAVRTLPKRSQRLQPELREERYGMSQHLHRSEAYLGLFLRRPIAAKPEGDAQALALHRRASSYTVGCASASCGTTSPHRCAATFGIAAGIAAASTDIALAAHCTRCANRCASAARGRKRLSLIHI